MSEANFLSHLLSVNLKQEHQIKYINKSFNRSVSNFLHFIQALLAIPRQPL